MQELIQSRRPLRSLGCSQADIVIIIIKNCCYSCVTGAQTILGLPQTATALPVRRADRVLNHGALAPTFSVGIIWDICCMHTWATLRCTFSPRLADNIASVARIRKVQRHSWSRHFQLYLSCDTCILTLEQAQGGVGGEA